MFPPPSRELQLIKLASTSSGTAAPALSSAPSITTAAVCNIYRWAVGATPRTTPLHFTPLHPTPRSRSPGQRVSACPSPRLPSSPARVLDRDVQTGRGPPAPHAREVSDDERARPIEEELLLLAQSIARGGGRSLLVSGGGGSGYSGGKERGRPANRERAQADPGVPGFLRPDFARNPPAGSACAVNPASASSVSVCRPSPSHSPARPRRSLQRGI